MGYLLVEGGRPLSGRIAVEGAKNAALPACVASLLTDGPIVLHRIPQLRDVSTILFTIGELGKRVIRNGPDLLIAGAPLSFEANPYSVSQMRASFLVLGPLVARFGRAVVPLPGGCSIGPRPVDLHLKGLQALGARVEERDGAVAVMADRLRGCRIELPFPSVGATEQLLMVASLADGETEIANGAIEPEVIDLVSLLRKMGSNVEIDGRTFRIEGRISLSGAEHTLIPDRMEAGTLLLAGAITGGEVTVEGVEPGHLEAFLEALSASGLTIGEGDGELTVVPRGRPEPVEVKTGPHPGFPTDLHPPLAAYLSVGRGTSRVTEGVFERRFTYVDGLRSMGAQIAVSGRTGSITGVKRLRGSSLVAPDIRAGAALLLAGLAAEGETRVSGLEQIDRGYAGIEDKLSRLGAKVERTND
ncbi:UDP-N-acetylglucosamine 1-carboxyvinyltransferase [Candidatus Acetothermia bacterium]|nr:MAG: UDP-N-acetylglucosamine 1-carboxyvinyltransferase [Candidatus Acetothermia bacterium]